MFYCKTNNGFFLKIIGSYLNNYAVCRVFKIKFLHFVFILHSSALYLNWVCNYCIYCLSFFPAITSPSKRLCRTELSCSKYRKNDCLKRVSCNKNCTRPAHGTYPGKMDFFQQIIHHTLPLDRQWTWYLLVVTESVLLLGWKILEGDILLYSQVL